MKLQLNLNRNIVFISQLYWAEGKLLEIVTSKDELNMHFRMCILVMFRRTFMSKVLHSAPFLCYCYFM